MAWNSLAAILRAAVLGGPALVLFLAGAAGAEQDALHPGEAAWHQFLNGHHAAAALAAREVLEEFPGDPRAICCLAEALCAEERAAEAREYFRSSAAVVAEGAASAPSGLLSLGRARVALSEHQFSLADSLLAAAHAAFVSAGNAHGELVSGEQWGRLLWMQGRLEEALALAPRSLALADSLGLPLATINAHYGLGSTAEHLERVVRQADTRGVPIWAAEAQLTLSIIARWRQDIDGALELRRSALVGFRQAGHRLGQVDCHQRIAAMHQIRGELTPALRHLEEASALTEGGGNPRLSGYILLSSGSIRYLVGEFEHAGEIFREAHRVAEEAGAADLVAGSLVNLGLVLIEQGAHAEALEKLEAALDVCRREEERRGEIRTLNNIGLCLSRMEDYAGAVERLERAAELAASIGGAGVSPIHIQRDIGLCYLMQGDLGEAERVLREALELAAASEMPLIVAEIRWGLARAVRQRGDLDGALRLLEEAITARERLRVRMAPTLMGGRFFGRRGLIYEEAIDLLYALDQQAPNGGYDRRAFAIAQQAKARMSLEILAEAEIDLRPHGTPAFREEEERILPQLEALIGRSGGASSAERDSLAPLIARLEGRLESLSAEARAQDPRYAELQYPAPPNLDELQRDILREGEVLISYALGHEASYLWAVGPECFRFVQLPARETIEQRVGDLLPLLRDYNLLGAEASYYQAACRPVSNDLLSPVSDLLAESGAVWFVPDGILHYLPFEALLLDAPSAGSTEHAHETGFAGLPFLIRRLPVGYVPAASVLALLRRSAPLDPAVDLLAIGDPQPPPEEELSLFARAVLGTGAVALPHARAELDGIQALFADEQTHALLGTAATLGALRRAAAEGPFAAVHIVAHGIFNERRPQYSGLLLGPEEGDDGFVTLAEIYGLELSCTQLTLAACSSALGEEIAGEGLVGLTRAFLYAGARNVVSALWEVSGHGTALFMQEFYRQLRDNPVADRVHALAAAKRAMLSRRISPPQELRADLAHPYFWAPFVLTGAGE